MNKKVSIIFLIIVIVLNSCTKDTITQNTDIDKSILNNTVPISSQYKSLMEGVFSLESGATKLGNSFVGVWKGKNMCFFSNKDAIYIYFEAGINPTDSSIILSGLWRSAVLEDPAEKITATIPLSEIKRMLSSPEESFFVNASIIHSNGATSSLVLKWQRPFSEKVKNTSFHILAHRGGGRNADNNPYAENSLKMFTYAEKMGATGLEIDIQLTKDNVPVIYHDPDINIRLTQKSPLVGTISDYNYSFLKNNIKLLDGQEIPTLEESLNRIIDSTEIKTVWLDIKVGGLIFEKMQPILENCINNAKLKNRNIKFFIGVPNDNVKKAVLAMPNYKDMLTLCELSLEESIELSSKAYAPRWTKGTMIEEMTQAKSKGILAFTWTIDAQTAIKTYLKKGVFDGILTNYPSILAYEFYIQE